MHVKHKKKLIKKLLHYRDKIINCSLVATISKGHCLPLQHHGWLCVSVCVGWRLGAFFTVDALPVKNQKAGQQTCRKYNILSWSTKSMILSFINTLKPLMVGVIIRGPSSRSKGMHTGEYILLGKIDFYGWSV